MKNIISLLILVITFGCNENRKNNIYQSKDDIIEPININNYVPRNKEKTHLLQTVRINNTSYQLYENLLCRDTTGQGCSTISLSILKNGIFKKELFKEDFFLDENWPEYSESVSVSTIRIDEKETLLQINFHCEPCAPGSEKISFIQFKEHQIKESKANSILGYFITKNGDIDGIVWQGYFAFELPYKLAEREDKLDLHIDFLKIPLENQFYFLKIKDGNKFPPKICELKITIDPFGKNPSATKTVTLNPDTKVTLIDIAVDTIKPSDNYFKYWVKIKVSDQVGWIENGYGLMEIGCQAAG